MHNNNDDKDDEDVCRWSHSRYTNTKLLPDENTMMSSSTAALFVTSHCSNYYSSITGGGLMTGGGGWRWMKVGEGPVCLTWITDSSLLESVSEFSAALIADI